MSAPSVSRTFSCQQIAKSAAAPTALRQCNKKALVAQSSKFLGGFRVKSVRAASVIKPAAVSMTATYESLGPDVQNKTFYPKAADHLQVDKPWYIIDAEGQTLGRLAVLVAQHLRGANLPTYSPSIDMGGYVVVINAEKVTVTGKKNSQKLYRRHATGRPGSMKVETFDQLQARIPERIIEKAVKGMLPKGRLGRVLFTHMKVYEGTDHPHEAQQPVDITSQIDKSFTKLAPLS
ncbi:60S ribosomal protein L13 [Cymbomonas tetramitiformis]|uniref:Large ribosomal subunit protein uL13c n=1 Tax=Cymbomonas tetramitiformis TaxID=36881 RepID=A0AAE0FYC5_9CHLO|nr:60S ribosomal protein L13 [Cymbomonas tetramitiformis]